MTKRNLKIEKRLNYLPKPLISDSPSKLLNDREKFLKEFNTSFKLNYTVSNFPVCGNLTLPQMLISVIDKKRIKDERFIRAIDRNCSRSVALVR